MKKRKVGDMGGLKNAELLIPLKVVAIDSPDR
jgi:hypothetical protein